MRSVAAALCGLLLATVATAQPTAPAAPAAAPSVEAATSAEHLVIQQAFGEGRKLTFYVDAIGSNGAPLTGITKAQVSVRGAPDARARSVRRLTAEDGIGYIVLLDKSGSTLGQSAEVRQALKTWIRELSPYDRMAIVTFGDNVKVAQDFTDDAGKLEKAADSRPTDRSTYLYKALEKGVELARVTDLDLPRRRAIVIVSDGVNDEKVTGLEPRDGIDMAKAAGIPVFAMDASPLGVRGPDECETFLAGISSNSNGLCTRLVGRSIESAFDTIHKATRRVQVVEADCPRCRGDGSRHAYSIVVTVGTRGVESPPYLVTLGPGQDQPAVEPWIWQVGLAAAIILIAVILFVLWRRGRAREKLAEQRRQEELVKIRDAAETSGKVRDPPSDRSITMVRDAPRPRVRVRLEFVIVGGSRSGATFTADLRQSVVLGRGADCDIIIPDDPAIALRQCEFTMEGDVLILNNLGPAASMAVGGGQQVTAPRRIENRDTFRLGTTQLRLLIHPAGGA